MKVNGRPARVAKESLLAEEIPEFDGDARRFVHDSNDKALLPNLRGQPLEKQSKGKTAVFHMRELADLAKETRTGRIEKSNGGKTTVNWTQLTAVGDQKIPKRTLCPVVTPAYYVMVRLYLRLYRICIYPRTMFI